MESTMYYAIQSEVEVETLANLQDLKIDSEKGCETDAICPPDCPPDTEDDLL